MTVCVALLSFRGSALKSLFLSVLMHELSLGLNCLLTSPKDGSYLALRWRREELLNESGAAVELFLG